MEIIKNKINHDLNIESYFQGNVCFLDIETTGFKRDTELIYLIGLLYWNKFDNHWVLKQYFANSKDKEKDLLNKFINEANKFDTLISYNGDAFDLPFINHRAKLYKLNKRINSSKSFDLYQYIRKNKDFLNLKNLKLKTVEESLGYFREDVYSGYDCIAFYNNYSKTGNTNLKNKVLKHNYDDLIHMLDIIEILDIIKEKKSIPFNYLGEKNLFIIDKIFNSKDTININGSFEKNLKYDVKKFKMLYSLESRKLQYLNIKLQVQKGYLTPKDKALYINLNDLQLQIKNKESYHYKIPDNIFILQINNDFLINNIKILIKILLNK